MRTIVRGSLVYILTSQHVNPRPLSVFIKFNSNYESLIGLYVTISTSSVESTLHAKLCSPELHLAAYTIIMNFLYHY